MVSRTVTINVVGDSSGGRRALDELAAKSESAGGTMGHAFDDVLSQVNRVGILGGFGAELDGIGRQFDGLSLKAGHLSDTIGKIGAAGVGIGAWLTMIGGEGASVKAGLAAAVNATDESWADWSEKMEAAAAHNEKFAFSTKDTYGALTVLTAGLHDPKRALDELNLVTEMASFKHVSLAQAAQDLVKGLNGSTKIFRSYGLSIKDTAKEQTALAEAQRHLTEVEDARRSKRHITREDDDHEQDAKKKLTEAQKALNAANAAQAGGKTFATPAAAAAQLQKNLAGQPEARTAGAGGQIKEEKTKVHDWFEDFGEHWGGTILTAFAGASLFGGVSKVVKKFLHRGEKAATEAAKDALEAAKAKLPEAPRLPEKVAEVGFDVAKDAGGGIGAAVEAFRQGGASALKLGSKLGPLARVPGGILGFGALDDQNENQLSAKQVDKYSPGFGSTVKHLLDGKAAPQATAAPAIPAALPSATSGASGTSTTVVHTHIHLDGREIGQHVATHTRDQLIDNGQNMSAIGLN